MVGAVGTVALNAPVVLGAYWVARHGLRVEPGLPRFLAAGVVGWCWVTIGATFLGAVGALSFGPSLGWAVLGLAVGEVVLQARPGGDTPAPAIAAGERGGSWVSAAALGLALVPSMALGCASLLGPVKVVSDGPIYHLYFAVRWWKAARLELVPIPFGENAATYFPAVGDLWFTWLVIGWGGDRLARVGQAPFLVLAAVACYAMCRRTSAPRDGAALATAWFVTSTPLLLFSFEPNVDTIFVAGYLAACYFFGSFARDSSRSSLILGAIAAGGAWGAKPTGTVFVPPLLAVVAILAACRAGAPRRAAVSVLTIGLGALVMPGFWFVRNAWLTGNPLYPLDLPALGWLGWYGRDVMRQGPYYLPRHDLAALGDIVLAVLDPRLAPLWLAAVLAAGWVPGGRGRADRRAVAAAAGLAVLNVALYWTLIPYRTQQRFFLQALGLAAVPLAHGLGTGLVPRLLGLGLLGMHVFTNQQWPLADRRAAPAWDLSPLIPSAVPPPLPLGPEALALGPLVVGCLTVALVAHRGIARRRAGLAVLSLGLLIGVGAGWSLLTWPSKWNSPSGRFYPLFRDFYAGWLATDRAAGPGGTRIAYAGTNIPYYLFGPGLRNDVRYVNIDRHRGWLLHHYHRQAAQAGSPHWASYPRPGWDRAGPDFNAWLENLRAEDIGLLVVTRVNPAEGPHNVADGEGFPIERQWADEHPEAFVPLYGVAERDPWFRLYRLRSGENGENRTDSRAAAH